MQDFFSWLLSSWWFPWLTGALGLLIGSFPSWYPIITEWLRPRFVASIHTAVGGNQLMTMYLRAAVGWDQKLIDQALYLRVTNNRDRPVEIVGYFIETQTPSGWRSLTRVEVLDPASVEVTSADLRGFMGMDPQRSLYLDLSQNGFDVQARQNTIQPGHSIAGWAFFQTSVPLQAMGDARITILDSQGEKTVLRVPLPRDEDIPTAINRASFKVLPTGWKPPWADRGTAPR